MSSHFNPLKNLTRYLLRMVQRTVLGPGRYLAGPTRHPSPRSVPPLCAGSPASPLPCRCPSLTLPLYFFLTEKKNPARLVFLRPRALTSPPGPIKSLSGIHPPRTYEVPAVGTCLSWTAAWATLTTSTTNDYQPVPRLPSQQTRSIQHPASSQAVPFASHRIASHRVCFPRVLSRPRINDDILDD